MTSASRALRDLDPGNDTERSAPGALMAAEIAEQPQAWQRLLDQRAGAIDEPATRIRTARPRFVLLAARGTSDHAALYAKYLVEVVLGLPAGLVSPSTMTTYAARPQLEGVLWVAVSQSGGSPDLVESTRVAGECGALTMALTNAPGSDLAAAATVHLDICAGPELAVAATKSYTNQLLALYLLVHAWAEADASGARALPAHGAQVLQRAAGADAAQRYRFAERVVTTGRGFSYPSAREAALKLMETSYLSAHAFSGADLLHGPLAMIDADRPVIALVPEGVGGEAMAPVLSRLQERGADVLVVGRPLPGGPPSPTIALPRGVAEPLVPLLQILPLQQLAHALAVARGHDPDRPRGLAKITETH